MIRKTVFLILFLAGAAAAVVAQQQLREGSMCLAYWENTNMYYVGTVVQEDDSDKGGGYYVVFADGDQADIPRRFVKPLTIKTGSKVMALWSDNQMYPGTVARIVGGALYIHFDDGDKGWTSWAGIAVKAD